MSHFYGEMKGNRGEATRCGTKNSGIHAHIRGWSVGARVVCSYDESKGKDVCRVYETRGSSGFGQDTLIATIEEEENSET